MTLDYARPANPEAPDPLYLQLALVCGLVPIVVGVGILLAFIASRAEVFPLLGLAWLVIGGLIVLFGGVFLLAYLVQYLRWNQRTRSMTRKIILLALLLVSNVGAAWLCAAIGTSLMPPMMD